MNENSLMGSFFPAVAGLFFFLKQPYRDDMYRTDAVAKPEPRKDDGRTGVARYLEKQQSLIAQQAEQEIRIGLTGVAKYIQDQNKHLMTRVAKYALRLELAEKQAKLNKSRIVETGVGRYLKNQAVLPKITGVAKYLKNKESLPKPSKVAKYITQKAFEEKQLAGSLLKEKSTGVSRYLKNQEDLPKTSTVAKYLTKQAILKKQAKPKTIEKTVTGVARYLRMQESLPKTSKVTKYIRKQTMAVEPTALRIETGVDKYLRSRF